MSLPNVISRTSSAPASGGLALSMVSMAALLLVMLTSVPQDVKAQSKTGTTIAQFLLIEPSARSAAMGNAGVSTFAEPAAVFFNPGTLGEFENIGAEFTHSPWVADIYYNYAIVAAGLGAGNALAISVATLSSGDIAIRTVEQPLGTGGYYSVNDLAIGMTYGRRFTDRFSGGIQLKYIRERIWNSSLQAAAVDVGVIYELPFRAQLGASVSNFGTRGSFNGRDLAIRYDADPDKYGDNSNIPGSVDTEAYSLPIFFRVGLSYPITLGNMSRLLLVADAYHPNDNDESVSVGAEWSFVNLLFLRGGYQNLFLTDNESGLTLGAGLLIDSSGFNFRFDYAWNDYGLLGNAQRFTVGIATGM